ncbi:MAG: molecular chaperone DnaK, partial [Rhodospirillales bacterium]|nr:molecular chaperone DnaK [Rhodospirillales bacterium]
ADQRAQIENDLKALKAAMEGDEPEAIKAKTEALMQSSMKLGEAMYKAQQDGGAGAAGPEAGAQNQDGKRDDNVVDADFEEVDEKKHR